jgi:hypothetical protein
MKMSNMLYDELKNNFQEVEQTQQETIDFFHRMHYSNIRIVWDIFWFINSNINKNIYEKIKTENLHDDHIQTALLKIGRELNIIA